MGKYSDSDIDAILKSIQENVDKQTPDTMVEDESIEPKSTKEASTPDELISLIMSDIGKKDEKTKKSEDADKYDISGFEIEEISDEDESENVVEEIIESKQEEEPVEQLEPLDMNSVIYRNDDETDIVVEQSYDKPEPDVKDNIVVAESESVSLSKEESDSFAEENSERGETAFKDFFSELSADASAIESGHGVYEEHVDNCELKEDKSSQIAVDIEGCEEVAVIEELISETDELVDAVEETLVFTEDIDDNLDNLSSVGDALSQKDIENDKSIHRQLDEADINVALALGDKEHIESSIGFVKVREAKHNFIDPNERNGRRTAGSIQRNGEYKSVEENGEIKDAYRKEKKKIAWRFGTTALVWLLLVFAELVFSFEAVYISYISEFLALPIRYHIVSIAFSAIAVAISGKKMLLGFVGFITNKPNYYTTVSVVTVINFIYSVLITTAFGDSGMLLLNSVAVLGILLNIAGEYMQLVRETLTFKLISSEKPKISLEKIDKNPETVKREEFLIGSDFYIENAATVGKYFERSAHRPEFYHVRHTYMMLTVLLSLLVSVIAVAVTQNFAYFLFACELAALLCIPTEFGFIGAMPFFIISKKLYRFESAIIGETIDDEYIGSNTVYMDDVEVFGNRGVKVVSLEPYNGFNIVNVNYYFLSVFSNLKCPLKNAFGGIPDGMKISDKVSLVNVCNNGIEARIDENCEVLIGTREFMEEKAIAVSKVSTDKPNLSTMFISVNGALCAKMYLKYTVTPHFEQFASEMEASHIRIGVRTIDPNISEKMLETLNNEATKDIKVIRPSINDLVPIERCSDSGIITSKNPHMIARILAEGLKVKQINFTLNILWVICALFGIASVIAFTFFGIFDKILPIYLVGYRMVCGILMTAYIANKLRNRKKK